MSDGVGDARLEAFPGSGEVNSRVEDAGAAVARVLAAYRGDALSLDETDGVSLAFEDWRFNLRRSNTEPLVRLNVEARGMGRDVHALAAELAELIRATP